MKLRTILTLMALTFGGVLFAQSVPDQQKPEQTKPKTEEATPDKPLTVAEAAREKSTTKKAKRVYTEDDIPASPEAAAAPAGNAQGDAKPDQADAAAGDEKAAEKPKEDSVEVKGAKKVVEAKQIQIDAVNDEMAKLQQQLADAKTPDEASSISQSIRNLQHNLDVWKNVRDDAQKVVDANKPKPKQ